MSETAEQNKPNPIPVKIPAGIVPRAYVNYDAEARAVLGLPLVLSDGFEIPPFTAGRLIAWEIVSTPFFLHSDTCDPLDAAAAIVLATCDPAQIPDLLMESRALAEQRTAEVETPASREASGEPSAERNAPVTSEVEASASSLPDLRAYPALKKKAADWLLAHGAALAADYQRIVEWLLVTPATGFLMRDQGKPAAQREWWFDGTFAGGVLAPACRMLGVSFNEILWYIPLCVVGHAVAQHDAAVGVKGIERPPDRAALDRMMKEAEARERRGELHPWQYLDPINYPLTPTQAEANPDLIGRWQDIVEAWHKKHAPAPEQGAEQSAAPLADDEERQTSDTREASGSPLERRDVSPTAEVQAQPGACPAQGQTLNEDIGFYV